MEDDVNCSVRKQKYKPLNAFGKGILTVFIKKYKFYVLKKEENYLKHVHNLKYANLEHIVSLS